MKTEKSTKVSTNKIRFDYCVLFVYSCFEDCCTLRDFELSFFARLHHVVIPMSPQTRNRHPLEL